MRKEQPQGCDTDGQAMQAPRLTGMSSQRRLWDYVQHICHKSEHMLKDLLELTTTEAGTIGQGKLIYSPLEDNAWTSSMSVTVM